ncbi:PREDICTED: putative defense protein 3 [Wasmannia auropunctata]|uniref:putative defense protein 3 n=1 Tax=Wasmannia auropunctata TaxID=64793 RepID=UPI0005EEC6E7|nr:PREDICTED: putative defense protein 3 [Wasmannia auropunctata]XP_011704943.1 PREDICTED: putative defense protein 3 [Wasmannia auropunctata]
MYFAGHVTVLFTLVLFSISVFGFPDGAPVDACVKPRPNQPYHGEARSQPLNTSPYKILASSSQYRPGTQVTVKITGAPFKGFFIQARDSNTNKWIGSWTRTPNTFVHGECSAVTHTDPHDKEQATFIWSAPADAQGSVYFTGTVLKDYATFWSDLVSQVA